MVNYKRCNYITIAACLAWASYNDSDLIHVQLRLQLLSINYYIAITLRGENDTVED